jgi:hypothetical protein
LIKNSFSILNGKIEELLKPHNFKSSFNNEEVIFKNTNREYAVRHDAKNRMVSLFDSSGTKEDEPCKSISSWFFSEEESTAKDIEDICSDFFEIMAAKKNETKAIKKSPGKDAEDNVGIIFFMNRLAGVFPNIKEKIIFEKENSENFRAIKFLNDEILPEVRKLFSDKNDNKTEKLFKLLENMYKNGNLDVRCIITMGILNSIEKEENIDITNKYLSDNLKKAWKSSLKYKKLHKIT